MMMAMFLWTALVLPWFTLFFLKKETVKKYFPVATITTLIVTIVFEIAFSLRWWEMQVKIVPWGNITNVSFVYGIFFIGTLWIFYFTFKKFWLYLLTNIIVDGLQVFVFGRFLFENRLYRLVNFSELQVFFLMILISLIIYAYQMWQDEVLTENKQTNHKESHELVISNPFKNKEKIR